MFVFSAGSELEVLNLTAGISTSTEYEAFYIKDDYMVKGKLNGTVRDETIEPHTKICERNFWFLPEKCQFQGVECEKPNPLLFTEDVYAYLPMSATWLFLSDYFNDELKPDHEKSMEKELTKQDGVKFRVRYKGAAGNRAHFEKHIIGDGSNENEGWEDSTLEEAIQSLLSEHR